MGRQVGQRLTNISVEEFAQNLLAHSDTPRTGSFISPSGAACYVACLTRMSWFSCHVIVGHGLGDNIHSALFDQLGVCGRCDGSYRWKAVLLPERPTDGQRHRGRCLRNGHHRTGGRGLVIVDILFGKGAVAASCVACTLAAGDFYIFGCELTSLLIAHQGGYVGNFRFVHRSAAVSAILPCSSCCTDPPPFGSPNPKSPLDFATAYSAYSFVDAATNFMFPFLFCHLCTLSTTERNPLFRPSVRIQCHRGWGGHADDSGLPGAYKCA